VGKFSFWVAFWFPWVVWAERVPVENRATIVNRETRSNKKEGRIVSVEMENGTKYSERCS